MGLYLGTVRINTPTSTGNQTYNYTDHRTGAAFTATFALLRSADRDNSSLGNQDMMGMEGATDGTRQWVSAFRQGDNQGTTQVVTGRFDTLCLSIPGVNSTTALVAASFVSFASGQITLNFTTVDAVSHPVDIHLFGGDEILDAYVGVLDSGSGTTNLSTTAPGFQPNCLITNTGRRVASTTDAYSTGASSNFGGGFASGASEQAAWACMSEDGQAAADDAHIIYDGAVFLAVTDNNTVYFRGALVSFDTNGFTITRAVNTGSMALHYIALRLANRCKVVDGLSPGASGVQSITGIGWRPQAGLFALSRATNQTTTTAYSYFSLGLAAGPLLQSVVAGGSTDAADPTTTSAHGRTAKIMAAMANDNASLLSEVELDAFTADGADVDWTTHDSVTTRPWAALFFEGDPNDVPVGTLAFGAFAPTVSVTSSYNQTVPVGTLTATGRVPTLVRADIVSVPLGELVATGNAPTPRINIRLFPANGDLALTAYVPTVTATVNVLLSPAAGALSLTGPAPLALVPTTISVPLGELVAAAHTPTVTATANLSVSIPLAELSLDSAEPTVSFTLNLLVIIPAGDLTAEGQAPAVSFTANVIVSVAFGELTAEGFAALVTADASVNIQVPLGELLLSSDAASVIATNDIAIEPPVGELTEEGYEPTVVAQDNQTVSPATGELELVGYEVSLAQDRLIEVPAGALDLTGFDVEITGVEVAEAGNNYVVSIRRKRRS